MGTESIELTGSECPECGKVKNVAVSITSSCKECGLDSLYMRYDIPAERIKDVLSAVFRVLDMNNLHPAEGVTGINSYEELVKRLNP